MHWQVAGTGCGGERQLWGSVSVPARGVSPADGSPAVTEPPRHPPGAAGGADPQLDALGGGFQPNLAEVGGAGSLLGERQGGGGEAAGWAEPLLDTGESSSSSQAAGAAELRSHSSSAAGLAADGGFAAPPGHREGPDPAQLPGGSVVPPAWPGMVCLPAPGRLEHHPRPSDPTGVCAEQRSCPPGFDP